MFYTYIGYVVNNILEQKLSAGSVLLLRLVRCQYRYRANVSAGYVLLLQLVSCLYLNKTPRQDRGRRELYY